MATVNGLFADVYWRLFTHSSLLGRIWGRVGEIITAALQDENFEVDARRCRERTMLLLDYYKKQDFPSLRRLVQAAAPTFAEKLRANLVSYQDGRDMFNVYLLFDTQVWNREVVWPKGGSSSWSLGAGGWEGTHGQWGNYQVPGGCHSEE